MNDVLACGIETATFDTFVMLGNWADKILVCANSMVYEKIPDEFKVKTALLDIGRDRWDNCMNSELLKILDQKLNEIDL